MNRPLPHSIRDALTPALLGLTALASIATSQALFDVSASVDLDPLTWEDGASAVTVSVETTGEVRRADITDLSLILDVENPTDESALLSLYQLPAPWDGALPDDAELLGSVMVRGALDGESGGATDTIHTGLDVPAELHLALLTDGAAVSGRATVAVSAFYTEARDGEIRLEVVP
jgi:hypothetical protein